MLIIDIFSLPNRSNLNTMDPVNNTQPPIPKIVLKRTGNKYKICKSKSKLSKRKNSKKFHMNGGLVCEEQPVSKSMIDDNTAVERALEVIAIDLSDEEDNSKRIMNPKPDQNTAYVIEIDSSDEDNENRMHDGYERYFQGEVEVARSRGLDLTSNTLNDVHKSLADKSDKLENPNGNNKNVQPLLRANNKPLSNKIDFVDLSSDDDNNNVIVEMQNGSTFRKNIPIDAELELEISDLQRKKVLRDITHLSELMYIIINSRRDYSNRILRSERLCVELISKERIIAEDNYSNIITVYGQKFTNLFSNMESKFKNINQNSYMIYYFIVFKILVGVNKIDHPSKISLELVKKLMILLLKRNFLKSPVFDVFKEESAEDCLLEFESAFLDWSFPEAFIPIED